MPSPVNAYTGETSLTVGGRKIVLRMRWREIAALRAALGGETNENGVPKWMTEVERACHEQDAETLATVVEILSDMSRDEFLDAEPPIVFLHLKDVLTDLVLTARLGPDWRKMVEAPLSGDDDDDRPLARLIRLLRAFRQPPASASPRGTSGS